MHIFNQLLEKGEKHVSMGILLYFIRCNNTKN